MTKINIILPSQMVLPNRCIVCGGSGLTDGRKFVDIGINVDYYGGIYFCVPCYTNGVEKTGFYSSEQFDSLHVKYRELMEKCLLLEEDNARYRAILDNVDFLATAHSSNFISSVENDFNGNIKSESSEESSGQNTKSGSTNLSNDGENSDDPDSLTIKL